MSLIWLANLRRLTCDMAPPRIGCLPAVNGDTIGSARPLREDEQPEQKARGSTIFLVFPVGRPHFCSLSYNQLAGTFVGCAFHPLQETNEIHALAIEVGREKAAGQ